MSDAAFRTDTSVDHEGTGGVGTGGTAPGKRAPTDQLQRKAERTSPPALTQTPRADNPAPVSGQSYVDSIVHGAVDPAKVVAEQIAHGIHDENKITDEVLWQMRPTTRGKKLSGGSADAAEWLRLRDEVVRPALTHGDRARAPAPPIESHDLKATPAPARDESAPVSGDAKIDALLASVPPNGSPNQVEAAWLLRALATGLVSASARSQPQLEQLAKGETSLRTTEGEPGAYQLKRGLAALEKKDIHVKRLEAGHYEVESGRLPVLGVMVDLAAGRIREWVKAGSKNRRPLFMFGDMVRADAGFATDAAHSQHTSGNAIDLGGMSFNNDTDVVAVLSGLDPGKIKMVFPDGGADGVTAHVHLALTDNNLYELGVPFSPAFFPLSEHLGKAKQAAQKQAGVDPAVGTTATARGAIMWHPYWYESTGTYQGGGTWKWADRGAGLARDHIHSAPLKNLLRRLETGTPPKVSVDAAREDGVKPKAPDEGH